MRKCLLLLAFIAPTFAFGQIISGVNDSTFKITNAKTNKIHSSFGLKGGLNRSIVNGRTTTGAKTGYRGTEVYGSLFADFKLTQQWNFENELMFSWTDDYHFVEIPLHLKFKLSNKWKTFAGPKLDIILDNENDPFKSEYKFRHFGLSGELGVQYRITNWLFAETRYSQAFTRQVTDLALDINNAKRNTFRLGFGVRL